MQKKSKSLTELRGIAQAIGCDFTFADSDKILAQKIALKQTEVNPPPPPIVISPPDDQRLRTKPPSKVSNEQMIRELLDPLIERGLKLSFTDSGDYVMRFNDKVDTGTLRQPPRVILACAQKVLCS